MKRTVVGLATVVVLGVAAVPAAASWSKPFTIAPLSAPFTFGEGPAIGVKPDGSFAVAWLRSLPGPTSKGVIEERRVDNHGNPGPVRTMTEKPGDVRHARVAVAPDGSVIVLWARIVAPQQIALEARRIDPDGTLGPVIHVSEPPERALTTALAVDSAGNVTVAWVNQVNDSSVLQVRRISATDKLGPLQTLTKTSEGRIVGVAAAVGPNRQPLVVYNQFGRIKAQRLSPSGKPLPGIMHISGADDTAAYLSAAADAAGVVRVSWGRLDPDPLQTFTRTVAADGTLGTTQTVSATRSAAASLAVNSAGDASIAWQDTPKDDPVSVQASTILPSGKPGPAFRLSPFSQAGGFDPEVGMDDQGTSMAVWQRDLGGTVVVEAARFTNAGLLGNVKALSRPSDLVPSPDVAVNPDGNALAVWWQGTPDSSQVRAKAALFLPPLNNPPTSTPPNPRCHGKLADIVGTRQGDPIVGTRGKDVIVGRGGNDKIRGRAGKDVICGDAGNDFLRGGRGHDRVFGGRGKDDVRP